MVSRRYAAASLAFLFVAAGVAAEASALTLKNRRSPKNRQRPRRARTDFIVLHTTEGAPKGALHKLRKNGEAHYLVDRDGTIFRIVDKDRVAFHAGRSMWAGKVDLDRRSVGIEVVGYHHKKIGQRQLAALKELVRQLRQIYDVPAERVLTHAQVAYGRPNRYHRYDHRGRKRCAMNLGTPKMRAALGLGAGPTRDPDVDAGRLRVADKKLFSRLFPKVALTSRGRPKRRRGGGFVTLAKAAPARTKAARSAPKKAKPASKLATRVAPAPATPRPNAPASVERKARAQIPKAPAPRPDTPLTASKAAPTASAKTATDGPDEDATQLAERSASKEAEPTVEVPSPLDAAVAKLTALAREGARVVRTAKVRRRGAAGERAGEPAATARAEPEHAPRAAESRRAVKVARAPERRTSRRPAPAKTSRAPTRVAKAPARASHRTKGAGLCRVSPGKKSARAVAGPRYAAASTIYLLPDGRVRTGADLSRSQASLLRALPKGTRVLAGKTFGGYVKPSRAPSEICGARWRSAETVYRFPNGRLVAGHEVNAARLPKATMVFCAS